MLFKFICVLAFDKIFIFRTIVVNSINGDIHSPTIRVANGEILEVRNLEIILYITVPVKRLYP